MRLEERAGFRKMNEEPAIWKMKLLVLDKRIKDFLEGYRQNVALLADDEDEVSYLLESYFQENKLEPLVCIHITNSYATATEIFKRATFSLLSEYLDKRSNLDDLINTASSFAPNSVNFIKETLRKNTISFLDVLEVINKFINDTTRKCVLIIEDFLSLEEVFPNFFKDFSKFIVLQRNCMVILTSSQSRAEKVLSTELNLLFGNFEKINLDKTTFFDHYNYLAKRLCSLEPSSFLLSFFVKIIGSNILYYDLMAEHIKRNYHHDGEEMNIILAIEEALFSRETYFFQRFIKEVDAIYISFKSSVALQILISISEGYLRKNELLSLSLCDSKQLGNKLQRLRDLNHIENLGNIYRIRDTLFSFWLSHVFKQYQNFPTLNLATRKKIWRKNLSDDIALYKEEYFKSKIEKVLDLLSSFKDDTLKMGKDKLRLPCFERTRIISYPDKSLHLIVGEAKEITFIGVKETEAQDNDIIEFLERVANIRTKSSKKIFISLGRFSPSARLIAKNNRLIIWDINEINSLLGIYNKSTLT